MSLLSSTTISFLRRAKPGVRAAAEAEIAIERQHADRREMLAQEFRAAVFGAVVDHDDFVVRIAAERCDHRWQVLFEKIASVPVGNDDAGGAVVRPLIRRKLLGAKQRRRNPPAPERSHRRSASKIGKSRTSGSALMNRQRMMRRSSPVCLGNFGPKSNCAPHLHPARRPDHFKLRRQSWPSALRRSAPTPSVRALSLQPCPEARRNAASSRHLASSSADDLARPFRLHLVLLFHPRNLSLVAGGQLRRFVLQERQSARRRPSSPHPSFAPSDCAPPAPGFVGGTVRAAPRVPP